MGISGMNYPTVEQIIMANREALKVKVSKADRHGILMGGYGKMKIRHAISKAKSTRGDIYTKAAALLIGIANGHPFESGNRRTAYLAAVDFLERNGFQAAPAYDIEVLRGVRARMYKKPQVAAWLKGNGS